jgi:DME family drug/metabolite transporter
MWNNLSMAARISVLLAAVLFGTTGTAQALGPAGLSPLTVGAARIVVGGAVLAGLALVLRPASARMSPALVVLAGGAVAAYQLTFFEAVHRAGVAVGAVVAIGSGPVVAGILERVVGGVWPGGRWLLATALAVTGIVALSAAGTAGAAASTTGIALALASGAAYAGYTVIAKRLLRDGAAPVSVMGAAFGVAALILLPVLLAGDTAWLHSSRGIGLAGYLALGPTVLAYLLFARGLRSLSASETTTIVLAEPVTAAVLAVAVLHERLVLGAAAGIALVLTGISVLALPGAGRIRIGSSIGKAATPQRDAVAE